MNIHEWNDKRENNQFESQIESEMEFVSVVDRVMDRLRQEEKWSAPTAKQFPIGIERFRKPLITAGIFGFVLFTLLYVYFLTGTSLGENTAMMFESGIQQAKVAEPLKTAVNLKDTSIVASITEPIAFVPDETHKGQTTIAVSLFGSIATILGLGWVLRSIR